MRARRRAPRRGPPALARPARRGRESLPAGTGVWVVKTVRSPRGRRSPDQSARPRPARGGRARTARARRILVEVDDARLDPQRTQRHATPPTPSSTYCARRTSRSETYRRAVIQRSIGSFSGQSVSSRKRAARARRPRAPDLRAHQRSSNGTLTDSGLAVGVADERGGQAFGVGVQPVLVAKCQRSPRAGGNSPGGTSNRRRPAPARRRRPAGGSRRRAPPARPSRSAAYAWTPYSAPKRDRPRIKRIRRSASAPRSAPRAATALSDQLIVLGGAAASAAAGASWSSRTGFLAAVSKRSRSICANSSGPPCHHDQR